MKLPENPFDSRIFTMLFGGSYVLLGLLLVVFDPDAVEDYGVVTLIYIGIAFLIAFIWVCFRGCVEWWRIGLLGALIIASSILIIAFGKAWGNLGVLGILAALVVQKGWGFLKLFVFSAFLVFPLVIFLIFLGLPLDQRSSSKDAAALERKFNGQDDPATVVDQGKGSKSPPAVSARPNIFEQPESKVLRSPTDLTSRSEAGPEHQDHLDVKTALDDLREPAKSPDWLNQEGLLLEEKGDLDGAIAEFRKAIKLDPKKADIHANLATALQKKGLEEEAQREFAEAERLRRN